MIIRHIRRLWQHFRTDHLFRNSIYLMATTGTMAGLGFFFWLISTHIFTPDQIGIGTALISAMTLISFVSLLGLNSTFVRILPNSKNRNSEINTGSILVIVSAAVIAAGYLFLIPYIAPKLGVVRENPWYAAGFVVMVALASINSLTDSIFVAYRAAKYNLVTDGLFTAGVKLLLPVLFAGLGAYGVFAAAGLAASIGMAASILILFFKFNYRPQLKIEKQVLKDVFHYSLINYIANLVNVAPTLVLPIIILDHLGPAAAGNFYLAFAVIHLLYAVANSVSQSFFAEGSYDEKILRSLLKRSAVILFAIMVPAGLILTVFGPFILGFFGKSYSAGGSNIIVMLAVAAPAVAAFGLGSSVLRITHRIYSLMVINIIYAASVICLTVLWIDKGLIWSAVAWLAGNLLAAVLVSISVLYHHVQFLRQRTRSVKDYNPAEMAA